MNYKDVDNTCESASDKECPNCKSTNITIVDRTPSFDGVLLDLNCLDCKHEWSYTKELD